MTVVARKLSQRVPQRGCELEKYCYVLCVAAAFVEVCQHTVLAYVVLRHCLRAKCSPTLGTHLGYFKMNFMTAAMLCHMLHLAEISMALLSPYALDFALDVEVQDASTKVQILPKERFHRRPRAEFAADVLCRCLLKLPT